MADIDLAAKRLDDLADAVAGLHPADLHLIGQTAVRILVMRTRAGLDADMRPFIPYTEAYKEQRRRKQLQTRVDLVVTGHMLGALEPKVDEGSVHIAFNGAHDALKGATHDNPITAKVPKRNWLDIRHPREVAALEEITGNRVQLNVSRVR